jgi:hypothetical protein
MHSESGRNKIAKRFEETKKVKRQIYFVKRETCRSQTKPAADLRWLMQIKRICRE